jgi:Domain of unknown function (DUF4124)
MRHLNIVTVVALSVGSLLATAGAAEIYRWKDANGSWHYADQPAPGAERVSGPIKPRPQATAASTPQRDQPSAINSLPVSNAVNKQVLTDVAKSHDEQCKKATEAYDKAIQARRIYKTDDKGVRVFLSDKEITQAQVQAGAQKDLACSR